ncbi:glycoside hydrolase family 3 N-terminal domain-containing protein [Rhodomicrobium lacus]|uniref:glycoside hydrolase family 3 N-terminal domain-containing protein n=1 Tax=Rhodomicrobium lacus TaxID=2498452 RepID=UPI0013E0A3E5|nr:glycoside hydrolase family 3 N-terminal domain-containing protein [Rhodomicrobium lacus]
MRSRLVALGVFGFSGAAIATPAPLPVVSSSAVVIFVNDFDDAFSGTASPPGPRATPAECRARALQYSGGACVAVEQPPLASPVKPPASPSVKPALAPQPKPQTAAPASSSKAAAPPRTPTAPNVPAASAPRAANENAGVPPAAKPVGMQTSRIVNGLPKTDVVKASVPKADAQKGDAAKASLPNAPASLRAMTGQLLLSGFSGRRATDPDVSRVRAALAAGRLAGVVVATSNISSSAQLGELLRHLGDTAAEPALIAVDQEGGPESALAEEKGFTFYPSARNVGQGRNLGEARALYREMAGEMSSLGISLNFGPALGACGDKRADFSAPCFAATEPRARAFAATFTRGHHDRAVLTALRAEPFGAGRATAAWRRERASTAMLQAVAKVDTADAAILRMKAAEGALPVAVASLYQSLRPGESRIRRHMAFGGAIIADLDLGTGGAPLRHGEAVVSALAAGADLVLVRATPDVPQDLDETVYEAVEAAVVTGRLSRARVEDAWRHVLSLKSRLRTIRQRMQVATALR